jgi:LTXXQ motif family protein
MRTIPRYRKLFRGAASQFGAIDMKSWMHIFAIALATVLSASPLAAQTGPFSGYGMMGPSMMGWPTMGRTLCDPRAAGLAEWQIAAIDRAIQPTDAQRPLLDSLKSASTQAAEKISNACPRELPQSPVGRLEIMEKRLTAMLDAVKTVRPAFELFYSSLTDEQKARLARVAPRRWGWSSWHWPWDRS